MGQIQLTFANGGSVNDLATISPARMDRQPYPRRLQAIGLAGSANPGDYTVQVEIEGVPVAETKNQQGGANTYPDRDKLVPLGTYVPPNAKLEFRMLLVPTTNDGVGFVLVSP
jgi:hypothetical protein